MSDERRALSLLALLSALLIPAIAARADQPPGQLSSTQMRQLRSQPLPILVPAYVPPGFRLAGVEVQRGNPNLYSLRYAASDGREFHFSVGDGGFGDADPDYTSYRRPFVVNSAILGPVTMQPYKLESANSPQWVYSSDYRSLSRLGSQRAILTFEGIKMTPADLRRIYSSLQSVRR
jgi:hypothetical protein